MKNMTWKNRKIGRIGSNLYVLLPKKVEETLELRKGMNVDIEMLNESEILLQIPSKK